MENDTINAVLVDEEAVGSVAAPGCGAKILHDDGAFNQLLPDKKFRDPVVCFTIVSAPLPKLPFSFLLLKKEKRKRDYSQLFYCYCFSLLQSKVIKIMGLI